MRTEQGTYLAPQNGQRENDHTEWWSGQKKDRRMFLSYFATNSVRTTSRWRALQSPASKQMDLSTPASSGRACFRRQGSIGNSWQSTNRLYPTMFTGPTFHGVPRTNTRPAQRAYSLLICICSITKAIQIPNVYHMTPSCLASPSLPMIRRRTSQAGTEGVYPTNASWCRLNHSIKQVDLTHSR